MFAKTAAVPLFAIAVRSFDLPADGARAINAKRGRSRAERRSREWDTGMNPGER